VARAKKSDPTDPDAPPAMQEDAFIDKPGADQIPDSVSGADEPITLAEPVSDDLAEPDPVYVQPSATAVPAPPKRRGVFLPLVLGGILSAGLGAAAVLLTFPNGYQPATQSPDLAPQFAALSERIDNAVALAESARSDTATLGAELASGSAAPDLASIQDQLSAQAADLAEIANQVEALDARLAAAEKRPLTSGAASSVALDTIQSEMEAMRETLADTRAELDAAASEAAGRIAAAEAEAASVREETIAETRRAASRAALSHVQAALETGAPIEGALADLASAGVSVPAELTDQAAGVPSLASLRSAYPDAARDALTLSLRDTAGDGLMNRTLAFLRSQSGARSLSPRAGDDPDAVLSRSEAALSAGDLGAAIAELSALPEAGKDRMAEWIGLAQRRLSAMDAVALLSENLN
jgi:hypothetical protein